eukprot:gene5953-7593_t
MVTHVILELYSSGNIILADGNYVVLALLRSHQFEDNAAIQVGHVYPVAYTHTEHKDVDQTTFISFLSLGDFCNSSTWLKSKCLVPDAEDGATNKKKKSKKCTLHQVLLSKDSGVSSFGPEVIDHCILMAELEPSVKVDELILLLEKSPESYQKLANSLACAPSLIDRLNAPNEPGYILCEDNNTNKYVDYTPYRFRQYESGTEGRLLKFDSFNDAVDEYYCRIEEQSLQRAAATAESAAKQRVDKVRGELSAALAGLETHQQLLVRGAALLEAFSDDVDKVILVIGSALASGMAWGDIR